MRLFPPFTLLGICDMAPSLILSNELILKCMAEFPVPLLLHMQSGNPDPLSFPGEMGIIIPQEAYDLWKHFKWLACYLQI